MNHDTRYILKITIYLILMMLASAIALRGQASDNWKFIVYGDTRSNDRAHRSVLKSMTENTPDYSFIINVGDVVEDGTRQSDWNTWQSACNDELGGTGQNNVPPKYMAVPGNHDNLDNSAGRNLWQQYLPGQNQQFGNGGEFFVFDYENARFILLNSDTNINNEQLNLLQNAIDTNTKTWLFAIWHHPIFPFGAKSYEDGIHDSWGVPLYNGGADIIFVGHAHYYVRSEKLTLNGQEHPPVNREQGTAQIIAGNGGAPLYTIDPGSNEYMMAGSTDDYGYSELSVNGDTLFYRHITPSGAVVDEEMYIANPKNGTGNNNGITASSENPPDETIDKAFDGDVNTKWLAFFDTAWIKYDFASSGAGAKVVSEYKITSANDSPERDPRDWNLLGSNDGSNWTLLDSRSGETFPNRFQTKSYTFNNIIAFNIYKLDISSNFDPSAANSTQIAEIEFVESGLSEPSITLSKSTFNLDETIVVNFSGLPGNSTDWVGTFLEGTPNEDYLQYIYSGGAANGTMLFNGFSTPGNYEARLFFNDSYNLEYTAAFTVGETVTDPGGGKIETAEGSFLWEGIQVDYQSTGGLTNGGLVNTPAKSGDYEIVSFGASHGSGTGKVNEYFDEAKMIAQGFVAISVRGEEDRKVEMWIRKNGGQSEIDIPADARAYDFFVIDGNNIELNLDDINTNSVHSSGDPYEVPVSDGIGIKVLSYFSDDSAELTDVGNGTLVFQDWGFGDGDGFATTFYAPGNEPPETVEITYHDGGGRQYVGIISTFTVVSGPLNQYPVVSFIQPSAGIVSPDLGVIVEASDHDGTISQVNLYINESLVRTEGAAPYEWGTANSNQEDQALLNLLPGNYILTAEARDDDGAVTSASITVTVENTPGIDEYKVYYGMLHSHTKISDGSGTPSEAYEYARDNAGLDFFGIADHDYYPDDMTVNDWNTIKNAANTYNDDGNFVTFWGFEWTSDSDEWQTNGLAQGHITIVNSEDFCISTYEPTRTLNQLVDWMSGRELIAFFNHPGEYGTTFDKFEFNRTDKIVGMELWNRSDDYYTNDGYYNNDGGLSYYDEAINRGWYIGASGSQDNHDTNWGTGNEWRMAVLAAEKNRASIYQAMKARRFYSTRDKNLSLSFKCNGAEMGSQIEGDTLNIQIEASDGDNEIFSKIELVKNGNVIQTWNPNTTHPNIIHLATSDKGDHLYVRVFQAGENGWQAISSPVFIKGGGAVEHPSLSLSKSNYAVNEPINLNYTNLPGNSTDWVGIYVAGTPNSDYLQYKYSDGAVNGMMQFNGLSGSGDYEARLFFNDSYNDEYAVQFTVQGTNLYPEIAFTEPSSSNVSTDLGVVIEASDPDGSVSDIALYIDNALVRVDTQAPYEWGTANSSQDDPALMNLSAGIHQLRAVATDNEGASTEIEMNINVIDNPQALEFPLRAAFYYPWYPQTWSVSGEYVAYNVELGYYSSDDPSVIDQHIDDMNYAKIDVAIASWWGIGAQSEDNRIPMLLNRTLDSGSDLRWAVYYEKEGFGDPSVDDLKTHLAYLKENYTGHDAYAHIDGKPVIFVYNADDGDCEVAERWAAATNGEWYVNLKVFGGYRECGHQPDSWHQYGPASPAQQHGGYSYGISPGFWRADEASPRLVRDPERWYQNVRDMVASGEPWQLIQTFNEWGEGTAIERCLDWSSDTDYGIYLDALHFDGEQGITQGDDTEIAPEEFRLVQNYPNPFNPSTTVRYDVAAQTHVKIEVYNIQGELISTLIDEIKERGTYEVEFQASNLPSGIYMLQMQAGDFKGLQKMMLIK